MSVAIPEDHKVTMKETEETTNYAKLLNEQSQKCRFYTNEILIWYTRHYIQEVQESS